MSKEPSSVPGLKREGAPELIRTSSTDSSSFRRKHWGSITDVTPQGILNESEEEEAEDGNREEEAAGRKRELDLASNILLELGSSLPVSPRLGLVPAPLGGAGEVAKRPRTKIVCAIGPACDSVEMLGKLLDAGMNVARLNFSHRDHAYHLQSLRNLRQAVQERRLKGINCHCAVLMDTKGPEIRTGLLTNGKSIPLVPGQFVELTSKDYHLPGTERLIRCSYPNLATEVHVGSKILVADGELTLEVLICKPERESIICRVGNHFLLGEKKNVNLPGSVSLSLPPVTAQDVVDISEFALVHGVDVISGSFTRNASTVRLLKQLVEGSNIRIHAKIESMEALRNLDEIIQEADGVHVSRGDLGMDVSFAKLPIVQKLIIATANFYGKPVVTSTQLLQSMTEKPRPTNAECTDVANAVLDGTDCVMLSAECASGKYPQLSVETMSRILVQAERLVNWEQEYQELREQTPHSGVVEAICSTGVETAMELDSRLIVVASDTGRMGVLVAKYRPRARILVCTTSQLVANQMCVSRGVEGLVVPSVKNLTVVWRYVLEHIFANKQRWGFAAGHPVVMVDSPPDGYDAKRELTVEDNRGEARWNMVQIMRIPTQVEYTSGMGQ
ncbi:pyruvate kinase [Batrachochytrium salamandrivorans]|nr:pyruvate kinase [Batrachochytrium salamandrivorans]